MPDPVINAASQCTRKIHSLYGLPKEFDEGILQFIVEDLKGELELASIFGTLCDAGLTLPIRVMV